MATMERRPLVTIGIPTYNRAALLTRAIESARCQDHANLEIVISDNASTDATEQICQRYAASDPRVRYLRQPKNNGPSSNFEATLQAASGSYFMWLGDDDWIDDSYVSQCVNRLESDPTLALVGGTPCYYADGRSVGPGRLISLTQDWWWLRMVRYYWRVTDNGVFYGIFRRATLTASPVRNVMGGDWLLIAGIASTGKVVMLLTTSVHRELGGATRSYRHIAKTFGLPGVQGRFPFASIALHALTDVASDNPIYRERARFQRILVGLSVGATILVRRALMLAMFPFFVARRHLSRDEAVTSSRRGRAREAAQDPGRNR